tara:strand:+ start:1267 stop:3060 length:1794 start_codon:yes stop_codon:yes gene_type:complete
VPKEKPVIRYTSRDFTSIRSDLLNYAKKYYPNTYRDYSEASFGSLMIDTVAYVGDILSFYLDYQTNESFVDTAIEYDNIIRLGKLMGHKFVRNYSSSGVITCFVVVPASGEGLGPDKAYLPILRRGSTFSTRAGSVFTLSRDIDFSLSDNQIVVATVSPTTGIPLSYAVKTHGRVHSGEVAQTTVNVGTYEKFRRIKLGTSNITEIISIFDSDGREYFEVDYLSQNVIYKELLNTNSDSSEVPNIIKPVVVARRFVAENEINETFLQFGHGSEAVSTESAVVDPSNYVLDLHGRGYTTDFSFDPSRLNETDKFGIAPENTTLTITYRVNSDANVNAGVGSISSPTRPLWRFANKSSLLANKIATVKKSLEVENEQPITGDISLVSTDELKKRIQDSYAAQNRAVTISDYKATVYSMPAKFGAIKRCNIVQDRNSFKRNLNMYVISNLRNGQLTEASSTLKRNLKTWINKNKMINDTIDILDAKIINLQVVFDVVANLKFDRDLVLRNCINALRRYFSVKMDIGENLLISEITNEISKVDGVSSAGKVTILNANQRGYSPVKYDIKGYTSADGKVLFCPENAIFEIKRFSKDLKGGVR